MNQNEANGIVFVGALYSAIWCKFSENFRFLVRTKLEQNHNKIIAVFPFTWGNA